MDNHKTRPEIMVDIETLGTKPGSAIARIAIAAFDHAGTIVDSLDMRLDLTAQEDAGMTVDVDTVLWWLDQSDEARKGAFVEGVKYEPTTALALLSEFVNDIEPIAIWAHSPSFDITMLECLYDAFGLKAPWSYKVIRDTRTLFGEAGFTMPKGDGVAHVAKDDVARQISAVVACRALMATAA
jgi:hypothetical protein